MITIGLDLSLTKTGITILDGNEVVSNLIKSKPNGDKPIDEVKRISKIVEDILEHILFINKKIDLIAIENLAFMARNTTALTQLSGLSYMVRKELMDRNLPFVMVAPTTLKKFITGKGNADKNLMMMSVYRDYNFESLDDNICDSYSLALLSMAVLDRPVKTLTKPQTEVTELIKQQLP